MFNWIWISSELCSFRFSSKGRVCLSSFASGAAPTALQRFCQKKRSGKWTLRKSWRRKTKFSCRTILNILQKFCASLSSSPSTTLALRNIFYYVNRGTIRKLLYFITNGFEPSRLSFFPRRVHVYQPVEIFLSHARPPLFLSKPSALSFSSLAHSPACWCTVMFTRKLFCKRACLPKTETSRRAVACSRWPAATLS